MDCHIGIFNDMTPVVKQNPSLTAPQLTHALHCSRARRTAARRAPRMRPLPHRSIRI
jgi:hypothetical protein